jgi:signal transduction histidine kinase
MSRDRGFHKLHAAGWIIAGGIAVVTTKLWLMHLHEVEQRAEEAERTRDETATRKVMEERLRIARELHDSLTHNISVIQVQAGVAVHLAGKRGEEASPTLLAIQEAATDAARELRATLGVLRAADDCDGSGLGQLDKLAARARAAGQPVTVTVTGAVRELPADVDQAAYRIVQEALTNVSRHAGEASVFVRLTYGKDALTVQVDDDGNGGSNGNGTGTAARNNGLTSGPGLGLVGMRERVAALGGRFHAGPLTPDGFRVRAELPVQSS